MATLDQCSVTGKMRPGVGRVTGSAQLTVKAVTGAQEQRLEHLASAARSGDQHIPFIDFPREVSSRIL